MAMNAAINYLKDEKNRKLIISTGARIAHFVVR